MKEKIGTWLNKIIKSRDRFAIPILLNYNGETWYRTTIGGLSSITITVILIAYSLVVFVAMISRKNSVINSGNQINNLMLDPTRYNLGDYKFMFSLYPASYNTNFYYILDPTYFKLTMVQGKFTRSNIGTDPPKDESTIIPSRICDDRFNSVFNSQVTSTFSFNKIGICPNTTDLFIGGNYFSTEYNVFYISIEKCVGESYWK